MVPLPGGGWHAVVPLRCVPSANTTTREHWRARARRVDEIATVLGMLRLADGRGIPPLPRARLRLALHFRDRRRRDPQNYLGGAKQLVDALVRIGVLVDDDAEHLACDEPVLRVDRAAPRAEAEVLPWTDGAE